MNTKSVMIVGVGGQGTLLASRILGNMLIKKGYDVKMSEVHGMAQRGGSVVTYVRYGEKVYSPIIEEGMADVVISFEKLEGLRYVSYLNENATMILNSQVIEPMPVITGAMPYPENVEDTIKKYTDNLIEIDALSLAEKAGNSKAVNVVLMGVLASKMEFAKEEWLETIKETVPEKFLDINVKAFCEGFEAKEEK